LNCEDNIIRPEIHDHAHRHAKFTNKSPNEIAQELKFWFGDVITPTAKDLLEELGKIGIYREKFLKK